MVFRTAFPIALVGNLNRFPQDNKDSGTNARAAADAMCALAILGIGGLTNLGRSGIWVYHQIYVNISLAFVSIVLFVVS